MIELNEFIVAWALLAASSYLCCCPAFALVAVLT